MAKRINEREAQFIAGIKAGLSNTESAKNAGYSLKSCSKIGSLLIRKPKIINAINEWKDSKRGQISKEDFIDTAFNDYQSLPKTEANAPRFLDIAGKALGYIGSNVEQKTVNNTLNVTSIDIKSISNDKDALLAMVRKMLADNSGQ
jgi:hypothetical protein